MESSDINETGNGPGEAEESDSGDSIFFTQKPQKSIDLHNAAGSPLCSLRSKPLSPRFLESDSSSEEDVPEKGKRHPCLPKYNFTFLNQRRSQGTEEEGSICDARNRAIHYSGVAGFFSCFGEMWPSGKRKKSFESTLPTVDADNEEITPITEDEKSDEEGVKIIDKRTFVYSLKPKITKSSQPWFKMAKTTKPTRKSQQHAGTKNTLQATSNKPEALSNYKHLDRSDAALIEVHEPITPRSFADDAHIYTPNLTHVNEVTGHGNGMSASDESNTESQSILQNEPLDIRGKHCDNIYDTNGLLSTKINPGDKKLENLNTLLNQESAYLFEDNIMKNPSPHRCKNKTPRKTNSNNLIITKSNGDIEEKLHNVKCGLETNPMTKCIIPSCNLKEDRRGQSPHEETELLLCANVEGHGDGTVQKNKKKKHKKKKDEEKQNGIYINPLELLDNEKFDNIRTVDEALSDMSDDLRHKKNRKAAREFDEDIALKQLPLHYTGKNSSSGLVESHGNCELVKNGNSGTDTIQGESVSGRKRKKKRKVPFVAETVENVTLHLSLSKEDHGADGLDISTNYIESAETNGPLRETELGNKVKKKKKKVRKENGELANTGPNAKVMEMTKMNGCNKSKDCESTEVIQHPCDEGFHMKKKKKKASQSIEKTAPGAMSPNTSECSERKKKGKKKKRQYCEGVEMEAEQSTVKKKKHKKMCFKDEQIVSTESHVEILPLLGRLEKSGRTKVKKRLYNPNENMMDSF